MADKLSIVNRALVRIGSTVITSFDEADTPAVVATNLYDAVVEDLFGRRRWTFCKGQVQISRLAAAPAARWDAAYQLPLGVENIGAVLINDHPIEFERQDDKILCNALVSEVVILEYTGAKVDEDRWPAWFTTLVEYECASTFAIPIGDRADLAEWYEKKALRAFGLCKLMDGQGTTARRLPLSRFMSARLGGSGRVDA